MKPKINFIRQRQINITAISPERQRYIKQRAYMQKLITGNHNYKAIIRALQEGITPREIAVWFVERKWTHVSENSFCKAIEIFRAEHPEIMNAENMNTIDAIVDGNTPNVDARQEADRLLRLQKIRLKLDVDHELSMKKLLPSTVKEIEATTDLIELIAKLDSGSFKNKSEESENFNDYPLDVRDSLRELAEDEDARAKLRYLTQAFAKKHVSKNATTAKSKEIEQ